MGEGNLIPLTHAELVKIAEKWLLNSKGCGFALTELMTVESEIPDAIGFRSGYSVLVEAKASRSDFLADAKKQFRRYPVLGMGSYRFYICEEGLIKKEELPERWGLVYVRNGKAQQVHGPKGNVWSRTGKDFLFWEKNIEAEISLLCSALRRIHLRGDLHKIYDDQYKR